MGEQAGATRREAEVLTLIGEGLRNADIAAKLHLSVRTVENHVSSLLRKHGVTDRRALAEVAVRVAAGAGPTRLVGVPATLTTFIGREAERDAILSALREGRLVTLRGPGGVGKTRLAAVIADAAGPAFPSGGAFIDLVPVRDGYVEQAVAAALDVTERPMQSLVNAIAERLGAGRFLLILDNCEHVIDAAAAFAERLLSACPGTRILATSRERLGIPGERTVHIGPLGTDAELLFHDRAAAAGSELTIGSAAIAEVCARLDGIPLAIELAAARSAALGPSGLLAALDDTVRLLAGGRGADERHRSLGAVLGWSYDLLDDDERRLFRWLAVFAGAFDLDSAVAVSGEGRGAVADLLGRLVDKSLLAHQDGRGWRLLDTVRAFAADRLRSSAEESEARQRHLRWAAAAAAELESRIGGDWRADFDRIAADLRAALANCPPGPDPVAHGLARALGHLTFARRFLMESLGHYEDAAHRAPDPALAAQDLVEAAGCAHFIHFSGDRAFTLLLDAAAQAEGNARAIALARAVEIAARYPGGYPTEVPPERLRQLLDDATAAGDPNDPAVAASLAAASAWSSAPVKFMLDPAAAREAERKARATGDPVLISAGLDAVRTTATAAGRLREAHRFSSERYDLLASMDRDNPGTAAEIEDTFNMACTDAIAAGDLPAALSIARQAQRDDLVGNHPYLSTSKVIPALVLTGELEEALAAGTRMWDAWQRAGSPAAGWISPAMSAVALAHGLLGDDTAFRLWRARAVEVVGVEPAERYRQLTFAAFVDARVAIHTGSGIDAALAQARGDLPQGWFETYARAAGAELAVVAGLPDAEKHLAAAAPAAAENDWALACLARAAGRLHGDPKALNQSIQGWERIGASFERAYTEELLAEVNDLVHPGQGMGYTAGLVGDETEEDVGPGGQPVDGEERDSAG